MKSPDEMIQNIAFWESVPLDEMIGRRTDRAVRAKRIATVVLGYFFEHWSTPDLARVLGLNSHTSILDYRAKVTDDELDTADDYIERIECGKAVTA